MQSIGILLLISLRNVFSHWVKSLIVGGIMLFGTFLVVLGTALLDSVEVSMAKSITSSLAGHIQVYAKDARDRLAVFGGMSMAAEDIGRIPDFARVKEELSRLENVDAVIPMGIDFAAVTQPGELERHLGEMRAAVREGRKADAQALAAQVKQIARLMDAELDNDAKISANKTRTQEGKAKLARVLEESFWQGFEADPLQALEYLDTEVAPLAEDAKLLYLRYVGTDLDLFAQKFDRFEVARGEMVPSGQRGILLNQKLYEDWIKNKVARELDFIKRAMLEQSKTVESDGILKAKVSQLPRQYTRVTFELDAAESAALAGELATLLPEVKGGVDELLQRFLTVNEENIAARHAWFYEHVAPKIRLYDVNVGDVLTLRSFTRSGYVKSVNVKVWGIYRFKGLERSDIAGGHNLVDMMTFRDLYGFMTEERRQEVAELRQGVGLREVKRESVEDDLFGGTAEGLVATRTENKGFDEFAGQALGKREHTEAARFDQAAIDRGVALNAAVILKDPGRLWETISQIQARAAEAKLNLQAVDWQTAAGIIGQFIIVVRLVLYVAIFIIFTVALVIINNSMITATMERVTEIGTMRAIGAQRPFVLLMFLLETIALGLMAGTGGALLGALAVRWLGVVGIPATVDILEFLFAGPRLYPSVGVGNLIFAFVAILLVSIASTLFPARIATRIQPVVAMQRKE